MVCWCSRCAVAETDDRRASAACADDNNPGQSTRTKPKTYHPKLRSVGVGIPQPQPGQLGGAAGYEELTPLVMQLSEPDKVR